MAKVPANNGYKGGPLPDGCPPKDAVDAPNGNLLRLVSVDHCTTNDFLSGHAEGKRQPRGCDDCTWKACSVYVSTTAHEKLAGLALLPNLASKKFIAHIKVDPSSGKIKPHSKDKEHLSFWMRDSFAPHNSVVKIVPL